MPSIQLLRKSTKWIPDLSSYKLVLEVISTQSISKSVFVKQRIHDFAKGKFIDVFAAVCTPTQLQDFNEKSPASGTSYFRDSLVELVARTPEVLEAIFNSIVYELNKLALDVSVMEDLSVDGIYTITGDTAVRETLSVITAHYRLPLFARPCGTNDIVTIPSNHYVGAQNTSLPGWLNCINTDPQGCKFKYNIAQDATLAALWPPNADKLPYAYIDSNGISLDSSDILITVDGIYWKHSALGQAPWPIDYVDVNDQGLPENKLTLILDFIY